MNKPYDEVRASRRNGLQITNFYPKPMDQIQKTTICEIQKDFAELFEKYKDRLPKGRYVSKTISALEEASTWAQKAIEYDYQTQPEVIYK